MTLGRAVSNLVAPPPCDSLPDVVLHKTASGQLGGAFELLKRDFRCTSPFQSNSVFVCVALSRDKADRWYWQQMAGYLLFGCGARLPGQRGRQCATQRQDPVHLWQVHPGNDPGGCSQSL